MNQMNQEDKERMFCVGTITISNSDRWGGWQGSHDSTSTGRGRTAHQVQLFPWNAFDLQWWQGGASSMLCWGRCKTEIKVENSKSWLSLSGGVIWCAYRLCKLIKIWFVQQFEDMIFSLNTFLLLSDHRSSSRVRIDDEGMKEQGREWWWKAI